MDEQSTMVADFKRLIDDMVIENPKAPRFVLISKDKDTAFTDLVALLNGNPISRDTVIRTVANE